MYILAKMAAVFAVHAIVATGHVLQSHSGLNQHTNWFSLQQIKD